MKHIGGAFGEHSIERAVPEVELLAHRLLEVHGSSSFCLSFWVRLTFIVILPLILNLKTLTMDALDLPIRPYVAP